MSIHDDDFSSRANVKLVRDAQGRNWICDAEVDPRGDLAAQSCVLEEELIFDRGFGG